VLQGSRWRVNELTYRVTKYPSTDRLSKSEVDQQMKSAFSLWEQATDLRFSKRDSGSVHIEIRFEKYEHGDGDPFDGPGGTLAHAYFPQYGGDVHVDDTEYWTIDSFKGTNLLQTITHELGHSLGLSHSDVIEAMMAPFYRGWDPYMKLDHNIKAIQALYGKKVSKPTLKPTFIPNTGTFLTEIPTTGRSNSIGTENPLTSRPYSNTSICSDPSIDVIVRTASGISYVFRGDS
jgi:matrix metalloproteinase-14 (membrane-inserted)